MARKLAVLVLLWLWSVAVASAQGKGGDVEALIEEALELSGTKAQIAQIPGHVRSRLRERQDVLNAEQHAELGRLMLQHFSSDTIYALTKGYLRQHVDRERLRSVVAWLRTPLARRMARLEIQASAPDVGPELERFAQQIQGRPPKEDRLALIARLDQATGGTEGSVELVAIVMRGLAEAIDPVLPADRRLKPGELEQILGQLRGPAREQIRQAALFRMLFTYRSVLEADLGRYVQYWETDTGRWFTGTLTRGLLHGMGVAAERFARAVATTLPSLGSGAPASPPQR